MHYKINEMSLREFNIKFGLRPEIIILIDFFFY